MFNPEQNPGVRKSFSYGTTLSDVTARNQINQAKGLYPQKGVGAGLPLHVTDVRASVGPAAVGSTCTVTGMTMCS